MNAGSVLKLLREKHSEDVFIEECSASKATCRLDGWAMKKSWAHPLVTGYEIKVSRSDFIKDTKWMGYLKYCNEFYFVCPNEKVIAKEEVPTGAGLYYVASTGKRLFLKKKAVYATVHIPEDFYRAILMTRVEICSSTFGRRQENPLDFWKQWLEDKNERQYVGRSCSRKLQQQYSKNVDEVKAKQVWLEKEIGKLHEVKDFCDKNNINIHSYDVGRELHDKVFSVIPQQLAYDLESASNSISRVLKSINEIKNESGK